MHRIPIDCMTAEDWKRVAQERQIIAKTVYAVVSLGDSDCGFPNEGVLGVFSEESAARALALAVATRYNEPDWIAWGGVSEGGISVGRGDVLVQKIEVKSEPT